MWYGKCTPFLALLGKGDYCGTQLKPENFVQSFELIKDTLSLIEIRKICGDNKTLLV